MRRILAAVAVLATGVLALPSPAQAAPRQEQYAAVSSTGDLLKWFWIDRIDGIIGCAQCVWRIDLNKSHELPAAAEKLFQSSLMTGLSKLSDAKVATDPRTAAALKSQALASLQAGARALGSTRVGVGVVGYYNTETGVTTVADRAWLSAADQDLADGFTDLQIAATDPQPNPWIVMALHEFDEAYAEIAAKAAI